MSDIIGKCINDKYVIDRYVKSGGSADIYMAHNIVSGEIVAAKTCSVTDENACESIRNEAGIIKGIQHKSVPVYYGFAHIGRQPVLLMEYIFGKNLLSFYNNCGKISIDTIVNIMVDICEVIGYLHSLNPPLYYCDLKPSNVMCADDGRIILIDYGSAIHADSQYRSGTKGYAAPEQFSRESVIDARTDVYGIGMLLESMVNNTANESKKLKHIIRKCTNKNRFLRYSECSEIMNDLLTCIRRNCLVKNKCWL